MISATGVAEVDNRRRGTVSPPSSTAIDHRSLRRVPTEASSNDDYSHVVKVRYPENIISHTELLTASIKNLLSDAQCGGRCSTFPIHARLVSHFAASTLFYLYQL